MKVYCNVCKDYTEHASLPLERQTPYYQSSVGRGGPARMWRGKCTVCGNDTGDCDLSTD